MLCYWGFVLLFNKFHNFLIINSTDLFMVFKDSPIGRLHKKPWDIVVVFIIFWEQFEFFIILGMHVKSFEKLVILIHYDLIVIWYDLFYTLIVKYLIKFLCIVIILGGRVFLVKGTRYHWSVWQTLLQLLAKYAIYVIRFSAFLRNLAIW